MCLVKLQKCKSAYFIFPMFCFLGLVYSCLSGFVEGLG